MRSHFDCFNRMCAMCDLFLQLVQMLNVQQFPSITGTISISFHRIHFATPQQLCEMKDKENEIVMRYATVFHVHLNDFRNCNDVDDDDKLIV